MTLLLCDLTALWGEPSVLGSAALQDPLGRVVTDTRTMLKGDFFVPLEGEHFNGHAFLQEAFKNGAQAALVSRKCKFVLPKNFLYWVVDDTLKAYQDLALLYRSSFSIPFIAVTGSSGKTTTRQIICSALRPLGPVLSTSQNNNNDVGVPQTLLQVDSSHRSAIVEMGMRGQGEIQRLSTCTRPDIAVITNIGTAHIGLLGSRENIANAKCEITSSLNHRGTVVIPAGDDLLEQSLSRSWKGRVIRVALYDELTKCMAVSQKDLTACLPKVDLVGHLDLDKNLLEVEGNFIELPLHGRHNARNLLLALAVARELGVPWELLDNIQVDLPSGRNSRFQIDGITVLDETYNASPEAVLTSLDMLSTEPGRHFAVLGTMLELGEQSAELHRQVAEKAFELGLDGLVVVATGIEAEVMRKYAGTLDRFLVVKDVLEAYEPVKQWVNSGDVLLLKASRKLSFERLLHKLQN